MDKRTKGPWKVDGSGTMIYMDNANGFGPVVAYTSAPDLSPAECQDNAHRIIACVNACEGITTEALEVGAIQSRIASACGELYEVKQQRDELLAALEKFVSSCDKAGINDYNIEYLPAARAAIAKARDF